MFCVSCGSAMTKEYEEISVCPCCFLRQSSYLPGAGAEVQGVESTRQKNFHRILSWLVGSVRPVNSILDVGCSDGLFLNISREYGLLPVGIEPDVDKASQAQRHGHRIINRFFTKGELEEIRDERFDVVAFNDSFEHIPNAGDTLACAISLLKENGILVLNVPSTDGIFFRIGTLLARWNYRNVLDRLWQKGYGSPHVYYFNRRNLESLCLAKGMHLIHTIHLSSFEIRGLWSRLRCKHSVPLAVAGVVILSILWPFLKNSGDIMCLVFQKKSFEEGEKAE